jgi:predicted enzyme related to lactoylglutathione lyase
MPTTLGLRTVIYHVPDLVRAKQWYADAFGTTPYFDEPFYVGFSIGGFELGLDPDCSRTGPSAGGAESYWGVANADAAVAHFTTCGAQIVEAVHEVGGGIRVALVNDPFGNVIGLIENPHFTSTAVA